MTDSQMLRTSRLLQNWFVLDVALNCWLLLLDLGYGAEGHDFVRLLASVGRFCVNSLLIIDENDLVLLTCLVWVDTLLAVARVIRLIIGREDEGRRRVLLVRAFLDLVDDLLPRLRDATFMVPRLRGIQLYDRTAEHLHARTTVTDTVANPCSSSRRDGHHWPFSLPFFLVVLSATQVKFDRIRRVLPEVEVKRLRNAQLLRREHFNIIHDLIDRHGLDEAFDWVDSRAAFSSQT